MDPITCAFCGAVFVENAAEDTEVGGGQLSHTVHRCREQLRERLLACEAALAEIGLLGGAAGKRAEAALSRDGQPSWHHPWGDFLVARARALVWMRDELGETVEQSVETMRMDPLQVQIILMTPGLGRDGGGA